MYSSTETSTENKMYYQHHQLKKMKQGRNERIRNFTRRIDAAFMEAYGCRDFPDPDFNLFRRGVKKDVLVRGMQRSVWRELHSSYLFEHITDEEVSWHDLCEAAQNAEWIVDLMRIGSSRYVNPPAVSDQLLHSFSINRNGFVRVYTDGICLQKGHPDAQAGIGVWFGRNHQLCVLYHFKLYKFNFVFDIN